MNSTNIFKDGVLVDVDVSCWSGAKGLKPEDLGLTKEDVAEAYHLGKKDLVPAEVIHGFKYIENKARTVVAKNSFPFPFGAARFITKRGFAKVEKELKKLQAEFNALVDSLIEKYDEYRVSMVDVYTKAAETAFLNQTPATQTFGTEYDPVALRKEFIENFLKRIQAYYPPAETLRKRFSLDWVVYEIAVPRMRKSDTAELISNEEKKEIAERDYQGQVHEKIDKFIDDVVKVLREETLKISDRISSMIRDGKVIKSSTIDSLRDFIDRFKELNFVGDQVVEAQLDSLRSEFLDAHSPEQFHDDAELQGELKRKLGELVDTIKNVSDVSSITGEYQRKIQW